VLGSGQADPGGNFEKEEKAVTLEEKRIDRLYQLMEQVKDTDTKATLKWAIFELEKLYGQKV
jgi:hypothetical protein